MEEVDSGDGKLKEELDTHIEIDHEDEDVDDDRHGR